MPKTVLLADDSVTIQRVVELTFAREDVRVVIAKDGDEAIEAITRDAPDVVLADIDMPGRSGFDVAQFIRRQPATAAVPVLLLAGAFEPVDQAQAHESGADGILTKPFDPAVLVSRVMELLNEGRGTASVVHVQPPPPSAVFRSTRAIDAPHALEPVEETVASIPTPAPDVVPVPEAPTPAPQEVEGPVVHAAAPPTPVSEPEPAPAPPPPPPQPADYFDQIDQAFAALSKNPRPPAPADEDELPALDDEHRHAPGLVPRAVPLTDAFAALLEAERAGQPDPALRVVPAPAPAPAIAPGIDLDALADQIARRVLAQLSDRIVRETVADITSVTAERLVREEIERIKRNIK